MIFSSDHRRSSHASDSSRQHLPNVVPPASSSSSWTIPSELVGRLDHREIIRQSAINEIITGEAEYLDDLNTYYKIFIEPLQDELSPSIFQHIELQRFLVLVISSLGQIRKFSRAFLRRLRHRQQTQQPLVENIGDVIIAAVLEWGPAYTRYAADNPLGELEIERQINQNLLFSEHISNIPHLNACKKDFRHFYSRATFRLARYVLLFTRLLDATPETHVDREPLRFALELVRRQCSDCNAAIESQQDIVRLLKLNSMITAKSDLPLLHLDSAHRKIYCSGKMLRKKDGGSGLGEYTEVLAVMFDHYFVILKKKKEDGSCRSRYHILEQPIRTEFLKVGGFNLAPEKRSRGLKTLTNGFLGSNSSTPIHSTPTSSVRIPSRRTKSEPGSRYPPLNGHAFDIESSNSLQHSRRLYPITLQPFGDPPRTITLYVESESAREHWRERFEAAISDRALSIKTSQVFELWPMALETFSIASSSSRSSLVNLPSLAELKVLYEDHIPKELLPNTVHPGAPTCSVPFISLGGRLLIAIGCKDGLWIGKHDNSSSFRKVLSVKNITQVAALQNQGYMIVLAGQVLLAYPFDALVHSSSVGPPRTRSITRNPPPTHMPKPTRPAVPYYQQLPSKQILSRATSASSQQSTWSRQSHMGTESDSCQTSRSSVIGFSLGTFGFESKQSTEDVTTLFPSGYDELLEPSFSPKKPRKIDAVSVPNSPGSSNRLFREFGFATPSEDAHTRSTHESFADPGRVKPTTALRKSHRASMACFPSSDPFDRDNANGIIKLSGLSDRVKLFKIGHFGSRTLLICAEKAKGCQTAFKISEYMNGSDDTLGRSDLIFKVIREFVLPSEAHDVQFHETEEKIFILHGNRCEVINLEDMKSERIPRLEESSEVACDILMQRIEESKLLSVLPITQKQYLFCYDRFAYCGHRNGNVIRKKFDKMIEWDGRPSRVTRHHNYVIGYSENLIEVWDLRTSTRVQIMHGKDIRCIYDGDPNQYQRANTKPDSQGSTSSMIIGPNRSDSCQSMAMSELMVDVNCIPEDTENGQDPNHVERQLPTKTVSQLTIQKHFESFHVSIRDSGNVYRVFNMAHIIA